MTSKQLFDESFAIIDELKAWEIERRAEEAREIVLATRITLVFVSAFTALFSVIALIINWPY